MSDMENPKATVYLVYPSWIMRYAITTLANMLVLAFGITIGVFLAPHIEKRVQASGDPQSTVASSAQSTPQSSGGPELIQPGMTTGSFGAYLILAHHVQSDELVVNGLDILKLEQGELNLLNQIAPGRVQSIVDEAKNGTHLYQVGTPKPTPPVPATTNTPHE
jgi:hypothetical protein